MHQEWLSQLRLKLRALLLRRRLDQALEDELQFHLAMREAHLQSEGLPPAEARSAARRQFGNATRIKESSRDLWTFTTFETFWLDLRYGARMLAKNPGFAAVAILTLALGIGANTAMFAITDAALLQPLPYPNPSQLVFLREFFVGGGPMSFSMPNFRDLAEQNHTFQEMTVFDFPGFVLTGRGQPTLLISMRVSAPLFSILGVKPALGRLIAAADDRPAAAPVAVISHGFWQDRLAGVRTVLGHSIDLSGKSYTVIVVLPPDFRFPNFRFCRVAFPISALSLSCQYAGPASSRKSPLFCLSILPDRLYRSVRIERAQRGAFSSIRRGPNRVRIDRHEVSVRQKLIR